VPISGSLALEQLARGKNMVKKTMNPAQLAEAERRVRERLTKIAAAFRRATFRPYIFGLPTRHRRQNGAFRRQKEC
jgi:hypothetical protein